MNEVPWITFTSRNNDEVVYYEFDPKEIIAVVKGNTRLTFYIRGYPTAVNVLFQNDSDGCHKIYTYVMEQIALSRSATNRS